MNNELITAVITTCNRPLKIVERAVNSIVNQTYTNWELIVVCDSEKKFSEIEIIKEYVNSLSGYTIKYYETNGREGANKARNIALNNSDGKYIAYLDDDDEWLPTKLEKQINEFVNDNDCNLGLVYVRNVEDNKESMNLKFEGMCFDEIIRDGQNHIGGVSNPMFLKEALLEVNGFDEELRRCQDYDVFLRVCKNYGIRFIDEVLVRNHDDGAERITNSVDAISYKEKVLNKHKDYLVKNKMYGDIMLEMAKWARGYNDSSNETKFMNISKQYIPVKVFMYRLRKLKNRVFK